MLKFESLRAQGVDIRQELVLERVQIPDSVFPGYQGRRIAQARLDEERVIRVVYEDTSTGTLIVTFYPGRRARYE